jgi:hypothetical protein
MWMRPKAAKVQSPRIHPWGRFFNSSILKSIDPPQSYTRDLVEYNCCIYSDSQVSELEPDRFPHYLLPITHYPLPAGISSI